MTDLWNFLFQFPFFMLAVIIHEVSHGWVALRLGDPTAQAAGRLTLNPLKHIDPMGTILLPLLLLLARSPFVIGWAKPVPINVSNLRHPKRDILWVGAAGPLSNFSLALLISFLIRLLRSVAPPLLLSLAVYLVLVNLLLGTFNLLPIPPLDGSRVLAGLLPPRWAPFLIALERWGMVLVILLTSMGLMNRIVWPIVVTLAKALGI